MRAILAVLFVWAVLAGGRCIAAGAPAAPAPASVTNDAPGAVDYAKLDWKDDVFYLDGKPFTGVALQRQKKTGALKCRYEFRDGRHHGLVEEWWPNGQRSTETHFANGVRHGTNTYWDVEGKPFKRQVWKSGVLAESTDPHELENK